MSRFHHDMVASAVKNIAFAHVPDFETRRQLPFQEPSFVFLKPDESIDQSQDTPVLISKKPEGQREIFIGLYDQVDKYIYMYSMNRDRNIQFVNPVDGPFNPVELPADLEEIRANDRKNRRVLFIYDVCRVLDHRNRRIVNVIIHDMSSQQYRLDSLSPSTREWLMNTYMFRTKKFREYKSVEDIHTVMDEPEDFPYAPENGVIFLQGLVPHINSPCVKYTPPEHARVYMSVQPVTTTSARIWRLHVLTDGAPKFFRAIPAVSGFYVPPTGAIVAFKVNTNEDGYWRFVPSHIRIDKQFPSSIQTVQRFITRQRRAQGFTNPRKGKRNGGAGEGAAAATNDGPEDENAFDDSAAVADATEPASSDF